MSNNSIPNIEWTETIKKEAKGLNGEDLGEVQEVSTDYIITGKGIVEKNKFCIPKTQVQSFDGHNVWFRIKGEEIKKFKTI